MHDLHAEFVNVLGESCEGAFVGYAAPGCFWHDVVPDRGMVVLVCRVFGELIVDRFSVVDGASLFCLGGDRGW